jgi:hypothetical protein
MISVGLSAFYRDFVIENGFAYYHHETIANLSELGSS